MTENPWFMGWSDGKFGADNQNPFPVDTQRWSDYERGYEEGLAEF